MQQKFAKTIELE